VSRSDVRVHHDSRIAARQGYASSRRRNDVAAMFTSCMQICCFGVCIPLDIILPALAGFLYYLGFDFRRWLPASLRQQQEGQPDAGGEILQGEAPVAVGDGNAESTSEKAPEQDAALDAGPKKAR
jgi:hypothetical protein